MIYSSTKTQSQDCGYYYDGFNVTEGMLQTVNAILNHDNNIEQYNKKADECIWRFHVDNPANIASFDRLISDVMHLPVLELSGEELELVVRNLPPEGVL